MTNPAAIERAAVVRIAAALTATQRAVISFMQPNNWYLPSEAGAGTRTMWALNDFDRANRGIDYPLQLVTDDQPYRGPRYWQLTPLGLAVRAHLTQTTEENDG